MVRTWRSQTIGLPAFACVDDEQFPRLWIVESNEWQHFRHLCEVSLRPTLVVVIPKAEMGGVPERSVLFQPLRCF